MSWMAYAGLAALFSALVAILSKLGLAGMNAHLATAIRTTAVMGVTWLFVWGVGVKGDELRVTGRQLVYLLLSAAATGGAWITYNKALQDGPATRVAAVDKMSLVLVAVLSWWIFSEEMRPLALLGIGLITLGTVLLVFA